MKRFLGIFLTVALTASMLVGCGAKADEPANTDAAATEETTEATEETAEATEEAATEAKASLEGVKAGFIFLHDENSTYDLNFMNAAKAACEALGVEYLTKTNIPEGQECYEAACELADAGCNFIFADSFGHEDYMIEAAKEFPEIQFCHATGTKAHTEGLANFHNAFASIYEGRYLAGIAAGMKLNEMIEKGDIKEEEAVMGYIGAYTYAEVISGYTSFYLGAKSVCPSATMKVTFTGSWYDETAEKEGANKLIEDGCVLISQHADSMGAPTACETAGVPNVSYNGSTESACPNTFIVSSRIDWQPYFEYCLDAVANGTEIATDYTGSLETGSVALTELGKTAPAAGTQEAIDAAKADLIAGKIKVFDTATFTVEGKALDSYMADVDTDANYEGDHEVIIDGEFVESGADFRSAPYFNINIDGIELLDTAF
ncbi:MAG: BMP family ABC transporter substrate-binding protein [Lachnospiraceae bacterium]|nr:BMP family ABC transporter substrate-binding protein [Lachnospiraceae bacterium]MDY4837724.1 BMP family ABC transporter substrate-binding protein [Lachnospiraceae bacterium]